MSEFRPIPSYTSLEVDREGHVRSMDTKEISPGITIPETIEEAFPELAIEEEWRVIPEHPRDEISERGAIRGVVSKELKRSRYNNQDPYIQNLLSRIFPKE